VPLVLSTRVSTLGDDVARGWDPTPCVPGRAGDGIILVSAMAERTLGKSPFSSRRCTSGHTVLHTFYRALLSRAPPAKFPVSRVIEKFIIRQPPKGEKNDYDRKTPGSQMGSPVVAEEGGEEMRGEKCESGERIEV